jgi:Na+-transporting NADH:ubiquinone oxidoreductase subunit C
MAPDPQSHQHKTAGEKPAREKPAKTLLVALAVALVCAFAVSTATVLLRPIYHANIERERAALISDLMSGILEGRGEMRTRLINLDDGNIVPDVAVATFDARKAAADPSTSRAISPDRDIASIGRRADLAVVHEIRTEGKLRAVVLPVHGQGYASTLRGYLAMAADGRTIQGLRFHEHGETPGIGGRLDEPDWLAHWRGRLAYDEDGRLQIEVVRGQARNVFQVDGITGATYTSRGINDLVRFWLGPLGYAPYLRRIAGGRS